MGGQQPHEAGGHGRDAKLHVGVGVGDADGGEQHQQNHHRVLRDPQQQGGENTADEVAGHPIPVARAGQAEAGAHYHRDGQQNPVTVGGIGQHQIDAVAQAHRQRDAQGVAEDGRAQVQVGQQQAGAETRARQKGIDAEPIHRPVRFHRRVRGGPQAADLRDAALRLGEGLKGGSQGVGARRLPGAEAFQLMFDGVELGLVIHLHVAGFAAQQRVADVLQIQRALQCDVAQEEQQIVARLVRRGGAIEWAW